MTRRTVPFRCLSTICDRGPWNGCGAPGHSSPGKWSFHKRFAAFVTSPLQAESLSLSPVQPMSLANRMSFSRRINWYCRSSRAHSNNPEIRPRAPVRRTLGRSLAMSVCRPFLRDRQRSEVVVFGVSGASFLREPSPSRPLTPNGAHHFLQTSHNSLTQSAPAFVKLAA